ncbi:cytidine deaminase [Corynebacterium glyciniphilum]|uniref:cytidine deaminase n=1 Tax=Corynebacterium glyciniphilum TaxID=1404244 RepID=UPI0009DCEF01|nr:cytidine deaminase [Corynebacterium glyciniphilum]
MPNASEFTVLVDQCQRFIDNRFQHDDAGAAAMMLGDGSIVIGTAPAAMNPAVELCHETEPLCAAYRRNTMVVASVCLHRDAVGRYLVLAPCGVCQERLAPHGPQVKVAVAGSSATDVQWQKLEVLMPYYWARAFPDTSGTWG